MRHPALRPFYKKMLMSTWFMNAPYTYSVLDTKNFFMPIFKVIPPTAIPIPSKKRGIEKTMPIVYILEKNCCRVLVVVEGILLKLALLGYTVPRI